MNKEKTYPFISIPAITIVLLGIICFFLAKEYAWKGTDGKGYTRIISSDGKGYYAYLPNIFINKSIAHQIPDNRFILEINGRGVNKYYAGTATSMLPFYGLGYGIAKYQGNELDGYSPPFQKAISLAGIFYLVIGLIFLMKFLRLYEISEPVIAFTLLVIVLGTNLLKYAVLHPAMSHIYSWCFIASFLYFSKQLLLTAKIRDLYIAAFLLGIIVLIRPLNGLIILILPFLAGTWANFKQKLSLFCNVKNIAFSGFIVLAIVFIQAYLWHIQSGQFLLHSYKDEGFYFSSPQILNVLFSFRKGLFIYTPITLLSLLGLVFIARKSKFQAYSFLVFCAVLVYFISAWWNWYYGPSFSQRTFVEYYAITGLLLATAFYSIKSRLYKVLLYTVSVLLVILNLTQNYQYHLGILSAWDMNIKKYSYVFLKTSPKYIGCLGGNNDILLYNPNPKTVFSGFVNFEKQDSKMLIEQHNYDKVSNSNVCNYTGREYNFSYTIPVNTGFITRRGVFMNMSLDRLELDRKSCTNALVVLGIINAKGENYFYSAFPINEVPSDKTGKWAKMKYSVEMPAIRAVDDKIVLYFWNRNKQAFYLDNIRIEVISVN